MTQFAKIKKGEILSESQFYRVVTTKDNKVQLKNELGTDIVVDSKYVESCLISGEQYSNEKKITMTEAANLLLASANIAMTVSFNKKVDEKEVISEIMKEVSGATISGIESAIKKGIKKSINGEERIIKGHHNGQANEFGRLTFIDMEAEGHNVRQVDPRTVNWMIIKGVKYTVK